MGQFLAIGITTKMKIKKKEVNKSGYAFELLKEAMSQQLNYILDIYNVNEDDEIYDFSIKDEVFHSQLIPFLETIYPFLYNDLGEYDHVLKRLKQIPASEWLEFAKDSRSMAFQFDKYGMQDYLRGGFSNIIHISHESVILSLEGKILMEEYGRQFKFLKYTMRQTFKQYSLAGALRIYITG